MFSNEQWLANSGADFYNGVATQSLRFDDGSSDILERSGSSTSDRKKWVFSSWVKRANLVDGTSHYIASAYYAPSNGRYNLIRFNGDHQINVWTNAYSTSTSTTKQNTTTAVFRDVSAWYHIVIAYDSTQLTAGNRLKIYVNGVSQAYTGDTINVNTSTFWNGSDTTYRIGYFNAGTNLYMAETNFVDGLSFFSDTSGTANTSFNINSFGETKNGVWIPIEYEGSYGTNGFRLQFDKTGTGTASASTIGADTSGNTHHFTSSGIAASDCNMPDSPENNFATMNSLLFRVANGTQVYSEGNLKYGQPTANSWGFGITTLNVKSGKWYAELRCAGNTSVNAGVINVGHYGYHKFVSKQNPQNERSIVL
jgi:hypothetical protein